MAWPHLDASLMQRLHHLLELARRRHRAAAVCIPGNASAGAQDICQVPSPERGSPAAKRLMGAKKFMWE